MLFLYFVQFYTYSSKKKQQKKKQTKNQKEKTLKNEKIAKIIELTFKILKKLYFVLLELNVLKN